MTIEEAANALAWSDGKTMEEIRAILEQFARSAVCEALAVPIPDVEVTDEEAAQMQARCDLATPGPWHNGHWQDSPGVPSVFDNEGGAVVDDRDIPDGYCMHVLDADFTAAARTDLPRLLADRRRCHALLRDLVQDGAMERWQAGYRAGQESAEVDARLLADIGFSRGTGFDHEVWVYEGRYWVYFGGGEAGSDEFVADGRSRAAFFAHFLSAMNRQAAEAFTPPQDWY